MKDQQGKPLLDPSDLDLLKKIWTPEAIKEPVQQVALLRIQRARKDVHHDSGFLCRQLASLNERDDANRPDKTGKRATSNAVRWARVGLDPSGPQPPAAMRTPADPIYSQSFDTLWTRFGRKWEDDLSFQS